MSRHNFVLKFILPDPASNPADFTDALFEARCDDAVVGVGRPGMIALDFCREEATADLAVHSAIKAVLSAVPGAKLMDVTPAVENLSSSSRRLSD